MFISSLGIISGDHLVEFVTFRVQLTLDKSCIN